MSYGPLLVHKKSLFCSFTFLLKSSSLTEPRMMLICEAILMLSNQNPLRYFFLIHYVDEFRWFFIRCFLNSVKIIYTDSTRWSLVNMKGPHREIKSTDQRKISIYIYISYISCSHTAYYDSGPIEIEYDIKYSFKTLVKKNEGQN